MMEVSPLAPAAFPDMAPVKGVRIGGAAARIRQEGRRDVMLAELVPGTAVAGVFTTSATAAPSVVWSREIMKHAAHDRGAALVVNAGTANVFTGEAGQAAVRQTAETAAELVGCAAEDVFIASTGVIGEPLPLDRLTGVLPGLSRDLSPDGWFAAADAIRTTDTFAKGASKTARIAGVDVTITGIAKGSGMIAPNMATMLGFIFTDAVLPPRLLKMLLVELGDTSFNAITVDGDTSTSDMVLLFATGQADHPPIDRVDDDRLDEFRQALSAVMTDLAQQIVRDGEGASKFITVRVTGAESYGAARAIAKSIANSPLVKTAIAGEDANWGRIVMAVGKAGQAVDPNRLTIMIGGQSLTEAGSRAADYDEDAVTQHLKGREIDIHVDLGLGAGKAVIWTCDLTHGYIDINADYRT